MGIVKVENAHDSMIKCEESLNANFSSLMPIQNDEIYLGITSYTSPQVFPFPSPQPTKSSLETRPTPTGKENLDKEWYLCPRCYRLKCLLSTVRRRLYLLRRRLSLSLRVFLVLNVVVVKDLRIPA